MKRIIGCLYGIFFEKILNALHCRIEKLLWLIEKDYLKYCRSGCENCYKWKCCVREERKTPYKKFRRPPFPKEGK